jgi:cytochrome c-type biogenesis protein CcsB
MLVSYFKGQSLDRRDVREIRMGALLKRVSIVLALVFFSFSVASQAAGEGSKALGLLPVQDAGRVKPYETFARETLQLVYGSESYQGRPAVEVVTTWMFVPQHWDQQKIVQINHRGLKEALKLNPDEKYFTPAQVFESERLSLVMKDLEAQREAKAKLDPYFQAVQRLEGQLGMYQAIRAGEMPHVAPPKADASAGAEAAMPPMMAGMPSAGGMKQMPPMMAPKSRWVAIRDLQGDLQQKFMAVTRAFIQSLPHDQMPAEAAGEMGSASEADGLSLSRAIEEFKVAARAENPEVYPPDKIIAAEVHYKELHPFKISWIVYLTAAIFMGVAWQTGKALMYRLGWVTTIAAFLMHTYGFGLRMYLTGRPPVSNMYESVVWVSWGALLFAMIFEAIYRRRMLLVAGNIVGVLCLVVADLAPTILDPSIQPLEPVLRSNLWLTVHVLTITISYSAFFLAWMLSNIGLFFVLRGEKVTTDRLRELVMSVYRALQVGVVLLAAGIILGGVWADYSWGRFWGWDPKETWALIALLGYLAMLHGRLVGWIQNFGMLVASIVSFNLVIMAWYGVNYVLGAGLHSYGFGGGGVQYVSAFVAADLVYVAYVAFVRKAKLKQLAVAQESAN